jgi:molybdenum cofactor guanylyltransferase
MAGREVAGAVLAGGPSRRMGRDKATLPVGGAALGQLALDAVAAVADPVALVAPAGHPANALLARAGPSSRLVAVADPGEGPLAALAAALRALPAAHLVVVGGDHPGLRVALLRHLVDGRATAPALACRRAGVLEPLVAVYRRDAALAAAEARLAGPHRSLRGLLADLGVRILEEAEWRRYDPDGRSFVDLDDPAALAAWQARSTGGPGAQERGRSPGDGRPRRAER